MIELISLLCSLVLCVLTPIAVIKIRNGSMTAKTPEDHVKFVAGYRRQLLMLTWVAVVFGLLSIGVSFVEVRPGERIFKCVAGAVWLLAAVICFFSRRGLQQAAVEQAPS